MSAVGELDVGARRSCDARPPVRAGDPIDRFRFAEIRRELLLKHCKWDPQVDDVATLASFPLLMERRRWMELEFLAERLTRELTDAEAELMARDDLDRALAIPRGLRRVLRMARAGGATPAAPRVMRFDFHWTASGWRISEVNADVPGGFSEASEFTRLLSEAVSGTAPPGHPGALWAGRIALCSAGLPVALLSAAGFMEDLQVISYLAGTLGPLGVEARLARPEQLEWKDGRAHIGGRPLGAIVRFYQAEWMARLPARSGWSRLFAGGTTPVSNPLRCVFGETKRFPLVWDRLHTSLPTWRKLLPETRDPREAPWRNGDSTDRWIIKTAWCNTGDTVSAPGLVGPREWRRASWDASLRPRQWVAQRRFEALPVTSPVDGRPLWPAVGVYTIDGRAAGAYCRISAGPVVNYRAMDAALLITETSDDC
ncbi:MAG TPA: glutathionylspermidine synthase family protein [Terriglobia bacterium]|nr:glutathionylspermidine synthase family protein [Terriglobia bacterium]